MKLLPIQVFRSNIISVVGMETFRLLIAGPFIVIEVLDGSGLVIGLSGCIIYSLFIHRFTVVDPVLNVISLSAYRVREYVVGFVDLFEHLSSLFSFFLFPIVLEIWVIDLRKLIVSQFDFL